MSVGVAGRPAAGTASEVSVALCASLDDLYAPPARRAIAVLLEPWLTRQVATPFGLLHRPALAAKLENSGADLQQALQKVAVPAALRGSGSVHEVIRGLHKVCDAAFGRLQRLRGANAPVAVSRETFAAISAEAAAAPDPAFALGCAVAATLGEAEGWTAKLELILDLADAAPGEDHGKLAMHVLEQPLGELFALPAAERELLGEPPDLGDTLAMLLQLAQADIFAAVSKVHPALANAAPEPSRALQRLAAAFARGQFATTRRALIRRILAAFGSGARLRPSDPQAEMELLRLLAVVLTAGAGALAPADDVREAVVNRSKILLGPSFLEALLAPAGDPFAETSTLLQVLENVAGDANRRRAVKLLENSFGTRRLRRAIEETKWPEPCAKALLNFRHRLVRAGAGVAGVDKLLEEFDALDALVRKPRSGR